MNPPECSVRHRISSHEMQFASLSGSEWKACSPAADERGTVPHGSQSADVRSVAAPGVDSSGGGSCLPVARGTKVPSRCSAARSSA